MKLPTIQESTRESENELKDELELTELNLTRESEAAKAAESANQELLDEILGKAEKESEYLAQIDFLSATTVSKDVKVKELEDALTAQEAEMTSEIADLKNGLKRIMSLGEENAEDFLHNKTIADLREERDKLMEEVTVLKKKNLLSPDKRKTKCSR
jgi:chromosome segregation ATPase